MCGGLGLRCVGRGGSCTGCGTLCRRGGAAGAFQHAGHELLVQRGRQLLCVIINGQNGVAVIAAGTGVGGVAVFTHGGQHPLPAGAAGQAAVHRDAVLGVQRHRRQQGAVAAAQIQRKGAPGPCVRQLEQQLVHPGSVLRTEMQPVRLGKELGAAALLLNDLDLHLKTFLSVFCLIVSRPDSDGESVLCFHKFLCFGILPEGVFRGKFAQIPVGQRRGGGRKCRCAKPAIQGRLPCCRNGPKVQFPVRKIQNKC